MTVQLLLLLSLRHQQCSAFTERIPSILTSELLTDGLCVREIIIVDKMEDESMHARSGS